MEFNPVKNWLNGFEILSKTLSGHGEQEPTHTLNYESVLSGNNFA